MSQQIVTKSGVFTGAFVPTTGPVRVRLIHRKCQRYSIGGNFKLANLLNDSMRNGVSVVPGLADALSRK